MATDRERVTGIGGTFLYSRDPEALATWYERHFGLAVRREEGAIYAVIPWRRETDGRQRTTTWAVMSYEGEPGTSQTAMFNYHVDDLARFVDQLCGDGIEVTDISDYPYGRFAWTHDPDGNKIELYQEKEGAFMAEQGST